MKWPPKRDGSCRAPIPKLTGLALDNLRSGFAQACRHNTPRVELMPQGHLHHAREARRAIPRGQTVMSGQLPAFLQELLSACPRTGEGVHGWLFRVARQLHWHMPALEIVDLLESRVENCGRPVPRSEIVFAVQNSLGCAWQPGHHAQPFHAAPKWPSVNQEQREAVIASGFGLVDLWELSNPRIDDNEAHTEEIIDRLFPGNPLLCCGKSKKDFDTQPREDWRGELSTLQFIVPSPMSAITGKTQDGRESKHTLNNTGPRRSLICEFDQGDPDQHAALLLHLAGYAPLVCAVYSGGKSLQGWFNVHGQEEEKVLKFFRYAVSLGADPKMWGPSQFCRMPDGLRSNGKRQTVFFLNFKPLEATR